MRVRLGPGENEMMVFGVVPEYMGEEWLLALYDEGDIEGWWG